MIYLPIISTTLSERELSCQKQAHFISSSTEDIFLKEVSILNHILQNKGFRKGLFFIFILFQILVKIETMKVITHIEWNKLILTFVFYKIDTLMSDVYNQRKDADGFLYITYTDETTLGSEMTMD